MPLLMCPNCNESMREVTREGVQIDMCPSCRGVWLDRGELEKLMSSVKAYESEHEQERRAWEQAYKGGGKPPYKPKKKRKSLLEMFEMFGD